MERSRGRYGLLGVCGRRRRSRAHARSRRRCRGGRRRSWRSVSGRSSAGLLISIIGIVTGIGRIGVIIVAAEPPVDAWLNIVGVWLSVTGGWRVIMTGPVPVIARIPVPVVIGVGPLRIAVRMTARQRQEGEDDHGGKFFHGTTLLSHNDTEVKKLARVGPMVNTLRAGLWCAV